MIDINVKIIIVDIVLISGIVRFSNKVIQIEWRYSKPSFRMIYIRMEKWFGLSDILTTIDGDTGSW